MSKFTLEQLQECAEQAALFADLLPTDISQKIMDSVGGRSALYTICADEAVTFCRHHWPLESATEDYWDSLDWYIESDNWFEEHITPQLTEV